MTLEMQITESGSKPTKLQGDGKKKLAYVTKATATMIIDDQAYKVVVTVTGPDKDGLRNCSAHLSWVIPWMLNLLRTARSSYFFFEV